MDIVITAEHAERIALLAFTDTRYTSDRWSAWRGLLAECGIRVAFEGAATADLDQAVAALRRAVDAAEAIEHQDDANLPGFLVRTFGPPPAEAEAAPEAPTELAEPPLTFPDPVPDDPPATVPLTVQRLQETGHAPKPVFTCVSCGREFPKKNAWVMHSRSHAGSMMQDAVAASGRRDVDTARTVAARIHEREAQPPAQNEKSAETFVERRARIARERANANMAARRA